MSSSPRKKTAKQKPAEAKPLRKFRARESAHRVQSAAKDEPEALRAWLNGRVGKTQRLAALHVVDELPRSSIGKVLKRKLREQHALYSVVQPDR